MCNTNTIPILVGSVVFHCVSVPLYVLFIFTILHKRKTDERLASSFFSLCVSLGIYDLLNAVVWLDVRLHVLGYFTAFYETKIGLVADYLTAPNVLSLGMAKMIGLLFLTFNRFSSM